MSSVRRIAKEVGVSVATVSRALNDHPDVSADTRKRILIAASKSGYIHSVGRRLGNSIGVVYPDDPIEAELGTFESAMLSGLLRGINERKYDLTFVNIERDKSDDETYTQFFYRKGVRGAVVRVLDATPLLAEQIAAEGFPHVLIAGRSEDENVSFVASSSRPTSRQAVEHLIELGHRRIALGVHSMLDTDHHDRVLGYRDALEAAGIKHDPDLEVQAPASRQGGVAMLEEVIALREPATAIYFTDPLSTVGALHRCLELKISVPQDLSIVGFDDGDVRLRTFPTFTAVCQDAQRLGLEAALCVTSEVNGETKGVAREQYETTLSIHDSTGPVTDTPVWLDTAARLVRKP